MEDGYMGGIAVAGFLLARHSACGGFGAP